MSISDDYADHAALFDERQRRAGTAAPQRTELQIEEAKNRPNVYVSHGPVTVGPHGVTHHEVNSYNVAQEWANGSTGIVASARSQSGFQRAPSEIDAQDLVTVDGMQITAQVAERLGYIVKDASGIYRDAAQKPEMAPQQKTTDDADASAVALSDKEAEGALADIASGVSASTQIRGLMQLIQTGEIDRNTMIAAASEMKFEPEMMAHNVAGIVEAFRSQAAQAVKAIGVADPQAFFDWAHHSQPEKIQEAMRQHGMERTTRGYTAMVTDYFISLADSDPEGVLNADFGDPRITARRAGNGRIVLNLPGQGEVEYRAALRQGIVKVGPK